MANHSGARRFSLVLLDANEYLLESVQTEVTVSAFVLERLSWDHQRNTASSATQTPTSHHSLLSPSTGTDSTVSGRLWIATNSLFFEPKLHKCSIVRIPFERMPTCPTRVFPQSNADNDAFSCCSTRLIEMKAYDQNYPYLQVNFPSPDGSAKNAMEQQCKWTFKIQTAVLNSTMMLVQDLWEYSQNLRTRDAAIQSQVVEPRMATKFDRSRLVDFRERVMMEQDAVVNRVSPLVHVPGRVLVTDRRVYFQPVALNNIGEACSHFEVGDVAAIYKRRYLLRDSAVELTITQNSAGESRRHSSSWIAGTSTATGGSNKTKRKTDTNATQDSLGRLSSGTRLLFAVESGDTATRDMIYNAIVDSRKAGAPKKGALSSHNPITEASALQRVQELWMNGQVDNYSYLAFLNDLAHRSMNDLTQYPVYPWVLADYTSRELDFSKASTFRDLTKPMGALNEERLRSFQERFATMTEDMKPFLYGTHYSTPGYVLYYLVRHAPDLMLRLQNGRFDEPDRLFVSIAETWNNVTSNPADLKELIPEFYDTKGIDYNDDNNNNTSSVSSGNTATAANTSANESTEPGNFLVNRQHIDLGRRQDGVLVDDTILPPWASSASDFVLKNRQALECTYVSERLHHWIDLVFGYKQRGEEALKADNLFYHMTYEGSVDFEAIRHAPDQLKATETQIYEFGQTPKQLFFTPHPARHATAAAKASDADQTEKEQVEERDVHAEHNGNVHADEEDEDDDDREWTDASQMFNDDEPDWIQHRRGSSLSVDMPFDPLQSDPSVLVKEPYTDGNYSDNIGQHTHTAVEEEGSPGFGAELDGRKDEMVLTWTKDVKHKEDPLSIQTATAQRSVLLHSGALVDVVGVMATCANENNDVTELVLVPVCSDSFLCVVRWADLSVVRKVSVTGSAQTRLKCCCAVGVESSGADKKIDMVIVVDELGELYSYNATSGMLMRIKTSSALLESGAIVGIAGDKLGRVATQFRSGRVLLWTAKYPVSGFGGLLLEEPFELMCASDANGNINDDGVEAKESNTSSLVGGSLIWQPSGKALASLNVVNGTIAIVQLNDTASVNNDKNKCVSNENRECEGVCVLDGDVCGTRPKCIAWIPDNSRRVLVCGAGEDGVRIVDCHNSVCTRVRPPVGVWKSDEWVPTSCCFMSPSVAVVGDVSGALWHVQLELGRVSLLARMSSSNGETCAVSQLQVCDDRPGDVIVCCTDGSLCVASV